MTLSEARSAATTPGTTWVVPGRAPAPPSPDHALDILVVMPSIPVPAVWGFAQRAFQLVRHLARRHRVTTLSYAVPDQWPDVVSLSEHVHEAVAVIRPWPTTARRRAGQVQLLMSGRAFHAYGLRSTAMQTALNDAMGRRRFDVVQLESSQLAWLAVPSGVPVVIDEHNIESELLGRMARSERSLLRRQFNRLEASRYARYEARAWSEASACAATSARDAHAILAAQADARTAVVPNGVDPDAFAPLDVIPRPGRLIFTGLVDYRPNYDGIRWFVDEVFPLVRRTHPDAELLIVGQGSPQALDELRRPGVMATGRVPELTPYLAEAEVSVIPLRIGGGTRLKLVEAMSMGKAVVSTSLGAEGIDALHGTHLMLADEPASFADAVSQLLDSAALRHRLGQQARALAVEKYSWDRSAQLMEGLHRTLVPERGPGDLLTATNVLGREVSETGQASTVTPAQRDGVR